MKVTYLGVNHRQGVSEKTNKPYSVSELVYSTPDESGEKRNDDGSVRWVYTAYGHKTRTLPLDPNAIHGFKGVEPFSQVDLVLEPQPENPSRNQVTGVK